MNDPGEHRLPDPRMIPRWQADPVRPRHQADEPEEAEEPGAPADAALVRPFMVTGGRTRPLTDGLRPETVVSAIPAALHAPLRFESRRIVELCQSPQTVVDIAVRLGLPLGVARVLVADLVSDGYATSQGPTELPIETIERIRDRVRSL
ncbi:DUF742 domain-containing protein [Dactylosporangium darangshiense]|uniref:DUF742 domain-containing protein n=1 Tax=Dactylosporangium darangshiense TaxID=579108 RepID=A0ABP8DQC2_9ACTN